MAKDRLEQLKKNHEYELKSAEIALDSEKPLNSNSKPKSNFWKWKEKSKYKIKQISTIVITIAFLLFALNIWLGVSSSYKNLNSNSGEISQKIVKLLANLKNSQNIEKILTDISESLVELQVNLKPVDRVLWPIISTTDLSNEGWQILQNWINASSNLIKFRITAEGFVSTLPRNFTDYLSEFFDILPKLIDETSNFLWKIRVYTSWVFWLPNDSIKKIKGFLDLGDDILDIAKEMYFNREGILDILGYKSLHKILLFNQNTGESRPTGGFIGSYLSLNISQGRFDIGKSQSIYNVDVEQQKAFVSFPVNWNYDLQYGRYDTHGIRNLNYFSCFPDTAKLMESEFSKAPQGQSADTVVFLTPNLIQNLFDDETELKINIDESQDDEISKSETITITKDNFYDQVEKITALDFKDKNNPKSAITPLLIAIATNLDNILAKQDPVRVGLELLKSGFSREIQIWSKNNNLQKIWTEFSLSGTQTCQNPNKYNQCQNFWVRMQDIDCFNELPPNPTLAFLQSNLSADKRDIFARHSFNFSINPNQKEGYDVELNYERTYKDLDKLQRRFNSRNGTTFIGFVLPPDAKNYSISSDQSFNTPFIRPFYLLKIKEINNKELYTPPAVQSVIDSSRDLNETSFTYNETDQNNLVIGTYVNEDIVTNVKLKYSTNRPTILFYPAPASNSNLISSNQGTNIINTVNQNSSDPNLSFSNGEGLIITKND